MSLLASRVSEKICFALIPLSLIFLATIHTADLVSFGCFSRGFVLLQRNQNLLITHPTSASNGGIFPGSLPCSTTYADQLILQTLTIFSLTSS
nr:MAG TPA: hypothetical protein [Caudoviricetes sp.]DAY34079.1 MAG TPA: hypothetical protein [Caudoviricetes sp.]